MLGIVGVLIRGLIGSIAISLPELIRRLLIALGVGVFVYTGSTAFLNDVIGDLVQQLTNLPPTVANVAGILNIDKFVNIVTSAFAIKLTFKSLGGANPKQLGLF